MSVWTMATAMEKMSCVITPLAPMSVAVSLDMQQTHPLATVYVSQHDIGSQGVLYLCMYILTFACINTKKWNLLKLTTFLSLSLIHHFLISSSKKLYVTCILVAT